MSKYALILLLINTYNCGWGIPLKANSKASTASKTVASNLYLLASSCHNTLISSEIKNNTPRCSFPLPEIQEFKCWTFYDINKQLCNASSVNIENLNKLENLKLNLKQFCAETISWPETNLQVYPEYSLRFKQIFSNSSFCMKVCESQDIFIEDVDFYCKYYKWGLNVLEKGRLNIHPEISVVSSGPAPPLPQVDQKLKNEAKNHIDDLTPNNEHGSSPKTQGSNHSNQEKVGEEEATVDNGNIKSDRIAVDQSVNAPSLNPDSDTKQEFTTAGNPVLKQEGVTPSTEKPVNNFQSPLEDNSSPGIIAHDTEEQDSGIDDLPLTQGSFPNADVLPNEIFDTDEKGTLHREPNPNDIKDNTGVRIDSITEDEDDHFFVLFLTGVIFVILLYVLYHNKNKVSKVVLGLIVEGRAGRRRNSRGHAYRRLDTLEQAVSASHPTPPTKIIY